jgi:hypothetical protein
VAANETVASLPTVSWPVESEAACLNTLVFVLGPAW